MEFSSAYLVAALMVAPAPPVPAAPPAPSCSEAVSRILKADIFAHQQAVLAILTAPDGHNPSCADLAHLIHVSRKAEEVRQGIRDPERSCQNPETLCAEYTAQSQQPNAERDAASALLREHCPELPLP